MKKIMLLFPLLAFVFASCTKNEVQSQSSQKEILSFTMNGIKGLIVDEVKTINFIFPAGTDISALYPDISVSEGASISPDTGIPQNFSTPVKYTVTAEDGTDVVYVVKVSHSGDNILDTKGGPWPDYEAFVFVAYGCENMGSASPTGYFAWDLPLVPTTWTITATPNSGYYFTGWYLNATQLGMDNILRPGSVLLSTDKSFALPILNAHYGGSPTVLATFDIAQLCQVSVESDDTNKGTVSGGGQVYSGQSISISSLSKPGYMFEGWYINGVKYSSSPKTYYTPTNNTNTTLVAKFVPANRTATITFHRSGNSSVPAECFPGVGSLSSGTATYQLTNYILHTVTLSISVDNNHIIELDEEPRGTYSCSGESTSFLTVTYDLAEYGEDVPQTILALKFRVYPK